MTMTCCDLHGRNCEPPSELCCEGCTEASHRTATSVGHPFHEDGTRCSNPDLSGYGEPAHNLTPLTMESAGLMAPGERDRINKYVAAELLAWAQECERRINGADDVTPYKTSRLAHIQLTGDLRSRAFALSPPSLDDVVEIEARLVALRSV